MFGRPLIEPSEASATPRWEPSIPPSISDDESLPVSPVAAASIGLSLFDESQVNTGSTIPPLPVPSKTTAQPAANTAAMNDTTNTATVASTSAFTSASASTATSSTAATAATPTVFTAAEIAAFPDTQPLPVSEVAAQGEQDAGVVQGDKQGGTAEKAKDRTQKQIDDRKAANTARKLTGQPLLCRHTCCKKSKDGKHFETFSDNSRTIHEKNENLHPQSVCGNEEKQCPMYDMLYGDGKVRREQKQAKSATRKRTRECDKEEQAEPFKIAKVETTPTTPGSGFRSSGFDLQPLTIVYLPPLVIVVPHRRWHRWWRKGWRWRWRWRCRRCRR